MMRSMVLGFAAAAAAFTFAAPAAAGEAAIGGHGGNGDGRFEGDFGDFRSPGGAHHDRRGRGRFIGSGYYGRGAYVDGSAWRSDSFNDWWHDQPHRAFPRWVATNQNCERVWWSGGGWRC